MAATVIDRDTKRSDGKVKAMGMSNELIPKGVLVGIDTNGYAVNGADTQDFLFGGVSHERVDNSTGSAGDMELRVEKIGEHTFAYNGGDASQSVVGKEVYIVDNQTVDDDALSTTNDIKCGVITEIVSTSLVRVRIDGYAR